MATHTGSYTSTRGRPPAVAGAFFTGDPQVLRPAVTRLDDAGSGVAGPLNQRTRVTDLPGIGPRRRVD